MEGEDLGVGMVDRALERRLLEVEAQKWSWQGAEGQGLEVGGHLGNCNLI
jgi:hypothetical protein